MDPSSLMDDWSKLSLTQAEEDVSVDADRSAVEQTGQILGCCLLGKLLLHKMLSAEVRRKTFKAVWRIDRGLQVEILGKDMFIFRFRNEEDLVRILNQGPWLFEKYLLIVEFLIRAQKPSEYSFSFVAF